MGILSYNSSSNSYRKSYRKDVNLDNIRHYLELTVGAIIMSLATNLFTLPAGLLAGGINGIAIFISYYINLPVGIISTILNLPLAAIALKFLNKKFTLDSIFTLLMLNISQVLTQPLIGILGENDLILNAIFSGLLMGLGQGLVYRVGASSLGTDVPATILKRKYNINIGTTTIVLNLIIVSLAGIQFGVNIALYTIISIALTATVADRIMLGLGEMKNIMIMSAEYEKISREIMTQLNRGVTYLDGRGAYSGRDLKIIMTVVSTRQIAKIKLIVDEIDPKAFMTIYDSHEVSGSGFRKIL